MTKAESIIVSVDFTKGKDNSIMIVGRKLPNHAVEVINAIQGEEAEELYKRLTTVKKEGE